MMGTPQVRNSPVRQPTVLVGVGPVGEAVLDRARESLPDAELLRAVKCTPAEIGERLAPLLEELLRAGHAGDRGGQRLDLLVFASALHGDDHDLVQICEGAARLLAERYAAVFPANVPPEQRTAGLQLVVIVPALPSPRSEVALARIKRVEEWARTPGVNPLLSRIWLVAQQTTAGTLQLEELVATCASFALAVSGSGLRDQEAIGRRLAHPQPQEGKVGFLSVASVDLPETKLRRYAAGRAAHDALAELVKRVEQPVTDPASALASVEPLKQATWLAPFLEGDAARAARAFASKLSGGMQRLPFDVQLGPLDTAEILRSRYAELLAPATTPRVVTQTDSAEQQELLQLLDRAETSSLAAIERGQGTLLATTLGPTTGLQRLPEVELGLKRLVAGLKDEAERDPVKHESEQRAAVTDPDPHREELERALEQLPSRGLLAATASAAGLGVMLLVTMLVLGFTRAGPAAPPPVGGLSAPKIGKSAPAPVAAPPPAWTLDDLLPWIFGFGAGVAAAIAFGLLAGRQTRKEVSAALEVRRDALVKLRERGGGGEPAKRAEAQLALRRRRVRRGALLSLEATLARLQAVRRTFVAARDRTRDSLIALGVKLGPDQSHDDLSGLLGEGGPLHGVLVPSALLSRFIARCREITEETVWADRFLRDAWPANALEEDVPCADDAVIEALGRKQVAPLAQRSVFADLELAPAAVESIHAFALRAPGVLAAPCQPRDPLGDPAPGTRPGEGFVVAPIESRDALERLLQDAPGRMVPLWTESSAARVLFVRTWEGYTVDEIARGAGSASPTQAAGGAR